MRGELITLDVETTGLDPLTDKIIEIGIIRSKDDKIMDEFHSMINPDMNIPAKITALTGITDDDVQGAPTIHKLLPEITEFIGDLPVLGHKVDFDLGMLAKYRVGIHNQPIDSYEVAAVMLPTAPRYSLSSLVEELGLQLDNAHRALDDTIATWHVYRELWNRILKLPLDVLREIVDHAVSLEWYAKPVFVDALRMRVDAGEVPQGRSNFTHIFTPANEESERLKPNTTRRDVDVDQIASSLEQGGTLDGTMLNYEPRDSQVQMLRSVATAFNRGDHLMVEAPTGTGKSLAYLIPAAHWAIENNERVVISTHTINLQDQLLGKDIPLLQNQLGLNFRAANLKGRSNYVCPRRLNILRRRNPTNVDELRVLAKVLVWLSSKGDGVKTDINLRGGAENAMWSRMTAQDEGCTGDRCRKQMKGTCPFHKARLAADRSHLLIVNHSLLLSDVSVGGRVLPEYNYLVLDEGHHLEDAITNGLSQQIDKYNTIRLLADLGNQDKGMLGDLLRSLHGIQSDYYEKIKAYVEVVVSAIEQTGELVRGFFDEVGQVLARNSDDRSEYYLQVRVTPQIRNKNDWSRIEKRWDILADYTQALSQSMLKVAKAIGDLERFSDEIEDYDNLLASVQSSATNLQAMHVLLAQFVGDPQDNMIYWSEVSLDSGQVSIKAAPLHVGSLVQEHIWEANESVVLTSATLRTANKFDYISERLSAMDVVHKALPTPFDYEASTMVYLPTDIPEPRNKKQYQEMVERGIIELASITGGRMLCLFTSYSQLRETASNVAPRLALGNIEVYDQSSGSSRQVLLDSFKSTEKAVLMGTRSFWEGVDVPGDDLSVVMIVRLPFSVPSDPIFAARSESFGESAFFDYSVPEAILRFRQGFGRLIRRSSDRGVVVIMDNRVISKGYGRSFLESLPKTTMRRGVLAQLPKVAAQWLEK